MPPIKEIHFFDSLFIPSNRDWTDELIDLQCKAALEELSVNSSFRRRYSKDHIERIRSGERFTLSWYRDVYTTPQSKDAAHRGDITPEYSTLPEEGVGYVREVLGEAKIIIVIRDPIQRALSHMRMHVEHRKTTSTDELISFLHGHVFKSRGDYRAFIPRWKSAFGDSILFIPFQRISRCPAAVIEQVEDFLDVRRYGDYKLLTSRIHESRTTIFSDEVLNTLHVLCAEQYLFLREEFSPSFLVDI